MSINNAVFDIKLQMNIVRKVVRM